MNQVEQTIGEQNLIALLGLESLPDEQKISILNKATDLVQQRVFNRLVVNMSEEQKDQFLAAVEARDDKTIADLMATAAAGVELLAIINEEIVKVKNELTGIAAAI